MGKMDILFFSIGRHKLVTLNALCAQKSDNSKGVKLHGSRRMGCANAAMC